VHPRQGSDVIWWPCFGLGLRGAEERSERERSMLARSPDVWLPAHIMVVVITIRELGWSKVQVKLSLLSLSIATNCCY